ncbi:glycoside hydrolase family 65 protein [Zunongwangia sp.]|uniref:glycoside hydrolase family 65 protein n=1 Tax=Zunongwangia sp. TaxID=1965325 RepID=UPI003AA97182
MNSWNVCYAEFDLENERLREALCTLGNGYFATRGALEWCDAQKNHYPGTYLAGGYNRLTTKVSGKKIENEDLVNWPNWLVLKMKIEDDDWISPSNIKIEDYQEKLDLQRATLRRYILFTDQKNRKTEFISERVISMANKHRAAIKWEVKAINWEGTVTIHSALDASVINAGVDRYKDLSSKHLNILSIGKHQNGAIFVKSATTQSDIRMAQATKTLFYKKNKENLVPKSSLIENEEYIGEDFSVKLSKQQPIFIEKHLALYTSKDEATTESLLEAVNALSEVTPFEKLTSENTLVWQSLWTENDIEIESDDFEDQLILRLHVFHLLQTYSAHTTNLDAGIPARGWHGEAYRGHIFWDEMFTFPLYNISSPEISRNLLLYRYRRLPEARKAAQKAGFNGAMFPWQSGSNGREENQILHLNPESGKWNPDNTYLQRHVNAAIAYNVWTYFETTGDIEFLSFYGAEMILDIAHFWSSKCSYSEEKKRFEIHKIVGPDEYHTKYPDSNQSGLKNNAYTNVMAVWVLEHALKTIQHLDPAYAKNLLKRLAISDKELERWQAITKQMYIPFFENSNVIAQFEGFDKLKDLDWEKYRSKHGENMRLDRILGAENDDINKYKAVKQADVLMLFYLFSIKELQSIFRKLGYDFEPNKHLIDTVNYYKKITSHGSTLSQLVHSWVYARQNRKKSWHNFEKALMSDFKDVQGGTTSEGIHLGAMAGTINLIQECYTGMRFENNILHLQPRLPENLAKIKFRLRYLQHWVELELTHDYLTLRNNGKWHQKIKIIVKTKSFYFEPGEEKQINYHQL